MPPPGRKIPSLAGHFIRAEWEEACLKTSAGTLPAMVMDWAEGRTLGAFLEAAQDDGEALRDIRERLARMLGLLAGAGITHGDLQTGNILVDPDGAPVLIDYDGMRLPGSPAGPASPDAHPNFQHPEWDDSCDPSLKDRFPSLALDLGLAAMAEDPGLFPRFSTGENVLFRAEDYAEPDSSPVFAAVRALPSHSRAAELLAGLALGPVAALPTLGEFRAEAWKARPGAAPRAPRKAAPAKAARAYRGVYEVFEASDYVGLLGAVGEKVEVVGRVLEVKRAVTRYGKPYAFVNFGDWRRDGFKLTVWSEGLETFRKPPTEAWEGLWVSATGLVDEPYESERFGNTQLSITIQDASQVRFLEETEARRRLGSQTAAGSISRSALPRAAPACPERVQAPGRHAGRGRSVRASRPERRRARNPATRNSCEAWDRGLVPRKPPAPPARRPGEALHPRRFVPPGSPALAALLGRFRRLPGVYTDRYRGLDLHIPQEPGRMEAGGCMRKSLSRGRGRSHGHPPGQDGGADHKRACGLQHGRRGYPVPYRPFERSWPYRSTCSGSWPRRARWISRTRRASP